VDGGSLVALAVGRVLVITAGIKPLSKLWRSQDSGESAGDFGLGFYFARKEARIPSPVRTARMCRWEWYSSCINFFDFFIYNCNFHGIRFIQIYRNIN
jgi:hypothetical protein